MRAIPHKVICLLGMNQGDFPRQEGRPSYDIMARDPKSGDKISRDEDRYLFLETLLAARKRLIITYVGRRPHDNQRLEPATVVSELLDFLRENLPGREDEIRRLVVEHPLQPFGQGYLDRRQKELVTYATEWLPVRLPGRDGPGAEAEKAGVERGQEGCRRPRISWVRLDRLRPSSPRPFCLPAQAVFQDPVSDQEGEAHKVISPDRFAWFFFNPAKGFLRSALGIEAEVRWDSLLEAEPYFITKSVKNEALDLLLGLQRESDSGAHPDEEDFHLVMSQVRERLLLEGKLPPGKIGRFMWRAWQDDGVTGLKERLSGLDLWPERQVRLRVETSVGGRKLAVEGRVGAVHRQGGLISCTVFSSPGLKLAFWVRHLLLAAHFCEADHKGNSFCFVLPNSNKVQKIELIPPDTDSTRGLLQDLAELFLRSHEAFVPLWPNAAWNAVKHVEKDGRPDQKDANGSAEGFSDETRSLFEKGLINVLDSSFGNPFSDLWCQYLFRGSRRLMKKTLVKDRAFMETNLRVLLPVLKYMKSGR
jgi:exonuclease V gamma subunit